MRDLYLFLLGIGVLSSLIGLYVLGGAVKQLQDLKLGELEKRIQELSK